MSDVFTDEAGNVVTPSSEDLAAIAAQEAPAPVEQMTDPYKPIEYLGEDGKPMALTPASKAAYRKVNHIVDPLLDLSPQDLVKLAREKDPDNPSQTFNIMGAYLAREDEINKDPAAVQRIAEASYQYNHSVSWRDYPNAWEAAKNIWGLGYGMAKQTATAFPSAAAWMWSKALHPVATLAGEPSTPFETEMERQMVEAGSSTQASMGGAAASAMARLQPTDWLRSAVKSTANTLLAPAGQAVFPTAGEALANQIAPEPDAQQKTDDFFLDAAKAKQAQDTLAGKGPLYQRGTAEDLAAAGAPVRPEEVEQMAAGDVPTMVGMGKVFGAAGKVLPEFVSPAELAASGDQFAAAGGKTLSAVAQGAKWVAPKIAAIAPAGGAVQGAILGTAHGSPLTGGYIGLEMGQKLAAKLQKIVPKLEHVSEAAKEVSGEFPATSSYTQLAKSILQNTPAAAYQMGKGALFDLAIGATAQNPEEANGLGIGTFFGLLGAGHAMGVPVLSGQLIGPRGYDRAEAPTRTGFFPQLDAIQPEAANEGVQQRVDFLTKAAQSLPGNNSEGLFLGPRDAVAIDARAKQLLEPPAPGEKPTLLTPEQAQIQATVEVDPFAEQLVSMGFSPEQATNIASQEGGCLRNLQGHDLYYFRDPSAAPHEIAGHGWEAVLGDSVMKAFDHWIQNSPQYGGARWEANGERYARRLQSVPTPGESWQDTVLRITQYGKAKEAEQGYPLTPAQQSEFANQYISREIYAENEDAAFKHKGGYTDDDKSLPARIARTIGTFVSYMGRDPLSGQVAEYSKWPLSYDLIKGVSKARAEYTAGQPIEPPKPPAKAFGGLGRGSVPTTIVQKQKAVQEAQAAAAGAPDTPLTPGSASQKEILGTIAEAVARGTAVNVNMHESPGETAATIGQNRETRSAEVEAGRTIPQAGKPLRSRLVTPVRVEAIKHGRFQILNWSRGVFDNNGLMIAEALAADPALRALSPFPIDPATKTFTPEGWQQLNEAVTRFVKNQSGGRTGSGVPIVVPKFAKAEGYFAPSLKAGEGVPQNQADFISMLFGFKLPDTPRITKGKLPLSVAAEGVSKETTQEAGLPSRLGEPTLVRAKPGKPAHVREPFEGPAAEKLGIPGHEIQEVNPLRKQIEEALGDKMPALSPALQRLNLENIKSVEHAPEQTPFRGETLALSAGFQPPREGNPADDLTPALRDSEGKIFPGEAGKTHADIYSSQPTLEDRLMLTVSQPEHGFLRGNEFFNRQQAAEHVGETTPLQSEHLRELQTPSAQFQAPRVNAAPAEEAPELLPEKIKGGAISTPHPLYYLAAEQEGNPWVRRSADPTRSAQPDNTGRTLLVQMSSDLINPESLSGDAKDEAAKYYDMLYSGARPGYARMQDFWEIPQWIGFASKFLPDADVYVVRDLAKAKDFLNQSGYDHVAFSALDTNKALIRELVKDYQGKVDVGGYVDPKTFEDLSQVKWHDNMESLAKETGLPYVNGVDYRHFQGSDVIPRLTMSSGCRHKCSFCTVEKKVVETAPEVVRQQADAIAQLGAKLVYLNDKTFGQASNYQDLSEVNQQVLSQNPDFKGFIVQTTAAQLKTMPADWLAKSGIKFVELGVESYNDPVLKAMHKPATESMINQVVDKLRQNHIALIPNIIIGHPLETAETYAHTLKFLRDNKDIISHANIYNLALYKDTELGKQVTVGADGDFNENVLEKSFHTNPEIHRQFAGDVYGLASEMLSGKPSEAQFQAPREEGEPEYPPKGAKIYPAGELNHRAQQLQNQVAMGKKTLQRAEDEISYLTAGRDFERYPVEQELQRKLQAHEISAEEHRHQLKVLDAGLDQKYKQADTIETWISNQWHIPQKGDPGWIPPPIVQGRNTEAESAGPSDQESWGQFPTQFQPQKGKFTLGSTDDDLTVRGKVFTKGPRAPVHESTPGVAGDTNWRYDHDTRALFTWGDSEESDPEVLAETEAWLKKRGLPVDEVQSLSEFDDPDGYHYNRAHFGSQFQPKPLEEGVQNLDDLPDTKEALFPSASAPVHAAVPEVSKLVNEATTLPPDQWNEMASAYSGGVSAYSHKVGMAVKSQADLLALRNAHGALNGLVEPAITAGDMDLAMALASKTQALREAYESATGRTMDGTKDTIATTRKIVDPNYQPPLPPPGAQFQAATKAGQDLEDKGFQLVSDDYGPGTGLVIRKVMKDDKEVASIQITQTSPDEARVNMVKVDPAYRNQGMAETLYREAATELQARGVTKLSGNVIHPAPLAIRAKLFGGPGRRGQNAWGAQSRNVEHNIPADVQFEPAKEESEGFKKWTKGAMIIPADNPAIHDVQTGKPVVVTGYHGTTRDFSVFDPNRGEAEGHFGKGIYVTTSQEDAKQNYAGFGPDLRNKIDREAERMAGADPADLMREYGVSKKVAERATGSGEENQTALRLAKKKFASHGGATMKVFVKLENPLVLGGKGEPFWDLTYDETTGQETGKLADLQEALNDSAASYGSRGFPMPEEFIDGGKASQVIDALRKSDELMQITDDRGDLVGPELIRDAIQRMGYDGIVDRTVDQNFGSQLRIGGKPVGMMGMNPDTAHIVAFKPEQVKSATGNRGTFDPTNPDIQYQPKTYIVRHGSTEMNADDTSKDKIRGFLNIPLSDKGKKEASALAEGLTGSGITTIITSDLKRAKQTADAIAKTTDAKVVEEPGLRPWHFGPTIEGKPTDDMLPVIKNLVEHPDEVPKGGESFNTFKDRFIGAFHEAQDKYPDETTALVTHYRGTKLLDAWRAEGVDNDAISREVFEAFDKDKKPATYDVVDKTGAQFQGAKREDPQSKENSRVYEKRSATHGWWMNSQGNLLPLTTGEHATDAIKILGIPASRQEKNDAYGQTALKAYHELTKRGWRAILPQTFFRSGQPVSTLLYRGGEETPEAAAATINKAQRNALERLAIKHDLVINNNLGDSIYRPPNTPASGEEPPMMGQAQYQAPKETDFSPSDETRQSGERSNTQRRPFADPGFDKELKAIRSGKSDGATFNADGTLWQSEKRDEHLVSLFSVNLPLGSLDRSAVEDAIRPHFPLLEEPGIKAGIFAFSQDGKPVVSIDINSVVHNKHIENTKKFAKDNDQVAIWDTSQGEYGKSVPTGGKGNTRLKTTDELIDAHASLTAGLPTSVDDIIAENKITSVPQHEGNLDIEGAQESRLSSGAAGRLSNAEAAKYYPESVRPKTLPRNAKGEKVDEIIPSDIVNSPLARAAGGGAEAEKVFGKKLADFAREYLAHPSFKSGLKWYSDFVPMLKAKFGKHAPLMAELLAGTSPNETPATNYAMALDALEGFKAGRFAKQIAKFEEGADKVKDGSWKSWIDREIKAGKVKKAPETPNQNTFINHWVAKYDLKPKKANGKLYGMSSDAVLKILARRWLANTPGLKTQQFVLNLLGLDHGATIDIWADRTMRRIGYAGFKERWRILPKNGAGVSDADFKFSQAAFHHAAKELGLTPDALQGGLWFAEKQLWADNGWGRLDLGDYRTEIAKTGLLQKGLTQQAATMKAADKAHAVEQPELLVTPRNIKP